VEIVCHRPGPPLAPDVTLLWHFRSAGTSHAFERTLPDGAMALIINLGEDRMPLHDRRDPARVTFCEPAIVAGPRADYDVIASAGPQEIVGVSFAPGGGAAFLPAPLREIADHDVDLSDLWGARAREWAGRLRACPGAGERLRLLERALLAARRPDHRAHPAVRTVIAAMDAPEAPTMEDLAARTGWSSRRLRDLFLDEVGLAPKVFQRVRRFQRALRDLHRAAARDLSELALECGYFDQAHFIHDFRAFSGMTPGAYLEHRTRHQNHAVHA